MPKSKCPMLNEASNTLYRGECRGVRHALELMVRQYETEELIGRRDSDADDLAPAAREAAAMARVMLQEYDAAVNTAVDQLIGKWASSEDSEIAEWATLLDLGLFDRLAV